MKSIPLEHPIKTSDGRSVESLNLRDMTIGDVEKASGGKSALSEDLALLSLLAQDLSPDDVGKLHPKDFAKAQEFLRGFLE